MVDLKEFGIRSYISEPKRGRRHWIDKPEERDAVYANRRRLEPSLRIVLDAVDSASAICRLKCKGKLFRVLFY